jgi:hypothetical protein
MKESNGMFETGLQKKWFELTTDSFYYYDNQKVTASLPCRFVTLMSDFKGWRSERPSSNNCKHESLQRKRPVEVWSKNEKPFLQSGDKQIACSQPLGFYRGKHAFLDCCIWE